MARIQVAEIRLAKSALVRSTVFAVEEAMKGIEHNLIHI